MSDASQFQIEETMSKWASLVKKAFPVINILDKMQPLFFIQELKLSKTFAT
jgi:hypothetical protein